MMLLDLPTEIVQHVATFLDWQSLLNFICTAKAVNENFIPKDDVRRLRSQFLDGLLAEETAIREEGGIPFMPDVKLDYWVHHPRPLWGKHFGKNCELLGCYTCLRLRPGPSHFSTNMSCGPRAVGQRLACERICIPCGTKTGFYLPGSRPAKNVAICEACHGILHAHSGVRLDLETFEEDRTVYGEQIAEHYKKMHADFYWWSRLRECIVCAFDHSVDLSTLVKSQKRITLSSYMARAWSVGDAKAKYARGMLNSKKRRLERAAVVRSEKSIPHPVDQIALQRIEEEPDPFPKYRPQAPDKLGLEPPDDFYDVMFGREESR